MSGSKKLSAKQGFDNVENVSYFAIKIALLLFHTLLLGLFILLESKAMIIVSAISVVVYLMLLILTGDRPGEFVIAMFAEIMIYTVAGVTNMGWDYAFQLYLIAEIPCLFYFSYLMNKLRYRWGYNPAYLAIANAVAYLLLRNWWTRNRRGFVPNASGDLASTFALVNEIITLTGIILFSVIYHRMTSGHEKALSTDAQTDQLTGLPNRRTMLTAMEKAERLAVKKGQMMAASIIDIDNFKHVNDTYGHDVGDIVLKTLAEEIKQMQQTYLSACRWGGEEFVFLCMGGRAYEDLLEEMNGLLRRMSSKVIEFAPGHSLQVTITCGIALAMEHESGDDLVKRADEYLYYGKMHGKNQVVTEVAYRKGGGNAPKD